MRFKNKTGWILEELEKKNECLNANEFGGENPEDVEKQREKNAKEINKRFDGVRKTAEKTVGDDHEEHAKPHKVEEHFKTRKELAEATKELKDSEIKFTVNRSTKEGFRYVLEYFTTARIKKDEPLFEKLELDEGIISGAKELSYDELANLEKSLWDKLKAQEVYPEDGTFSNSSNRLADLDLELLIDGDWKHDHLLAEHLVEEWCKENGYVITRHTEEVTNDTGRDDYEAEHHWFLIKDTDGKMTDRVNGFKRMFSKDESLNEGHITNEYKGYELDWNDDALDLENGTADLTIFIMKNGREVAQAKSFKEARKWIDENGEPELPKKVHLDKPNPEDYETDDEDVLSDLKIMPYGEVTEEQWEEFRDKAKYIYWLDWESLINEIQGGADWGSLIEECLKKVNEDLPDAIPEEPLIVSTDVAPEVPAEIVPDEVVQTGIYSALSSELRDTLADIENLKSLTVTLVDEGREDIVDDLNTIIDDRTIHVGMLQTLMEKVDAKVEDAPVEEEPIEEPVEENLKEAVDIHVEDNEIIVSKDLEDVAIIPVDGEEEVKEESLKESDDKSFTFMGKEVKWIDGVEEPYYAIYFDGEYPVEAHSKEEAKQLIKDRLGESLNEDMKPWFMQHGDNGEPEYIGFAKSHDDMLDKMVKSHASDSIGENTYIDELDKDTYEYIKKDLSDDEVKELDNYFKECLKEDSHNGYACKPYDNLSDEEEQIRHELEWDLGAKEDKMGITLSHAYDDMMRDYKYVRGNDNAMNKLMKAFNISKEDLLRYIDYKQDGLLVPKDHHKTR